MSSEQGTPSASSRPRRDLACVLCHQRKVKCDRKFPCANCTKSRVQCIPGAKLPRRRKRRFPERQLLDQVQMYEELLRQNNIKFEPLHKDTSVTKESSHVEDDGVDSDEDQRGDGEHLSPETPLKTEHGIGAKNFWQAMRLSFRDDDDDSDLPDEGGDNMIKNAWDQTNLGDDHVFFFGTRQIAVDLSTLHPNPLQAFKLWQIYLDNVNPLIKVIHAPTLQGRIIEAIGDLKSIRPVLEALMFGIYSMAILSLSADECLVVFGSPRSALLKRYQLGCQQALLNAEFLRCSERDCLTALYLYMVSVSATTDPRVLSHMLGLVIRIAQHMKIDNEAACAGHGVLEGEMRRRLWWALVLFDTRTCQRADHKSQTLTPIWDCGVPLNVNDADLRPEMKEPPDVHAQPTEAICMVLRCKIADFVRNAMYHLDFTAPNLMPIAKNAYKGMIPEREALVALEKTIEDEYLKFCDHKNPLQFMTIWEVRGHFAKSRLLEYYSTWSNTSVTPEEAQLNGAAAQALRMLECDTKITTSPLTKSLRWMIRYHFPFPAYIHLLKDLKRRPLGENANAVWEAMSDNCEARFDLTLQDGGPFMHLLARLIQQAWFAREMTFTHPSDAMPPPRIVMHTRNFERRAQVPQVTGQAGVDQSLYVGMDTLPMQMPMGFDSRELLAFMGGYDGFVAQAPEEFQTFPGQFALDTDMHQVGW